MSKKRAPKPFLGQPTTRANQSAIASLIGMTTLTLGLPKKKIRNPQQIWDVTDAMFGLKPHDGEEFYAAVRRIRNAIHRIPEEQRRMHRASGAVKLGYDTGPQIRLVVSNDTVLKPERVKREKVARKPSPEKKNEFYKSWEWRTLRMEVIKKQGKRCNCCGATPEDLTIGGSRVRLVVDHIKPLSKYWQLRLTPSNLQILCDECNMGKGAWDETDHRSESQRLIEQQLSYEVI